MRRPRFLVIGCGSIGKRHIGNLKRLGAGSVLAFDPRPDRREEARRRFGASTASSLREAWAARPENVLVTTPTAAHVPPALEAARRGCGIFIEKPLSHDMAGVGDLLKEVKKRRLVTLVGCNMRFHPGLVEVKRLVARGAVGRPTAVRAEVGQYLPDWRPAEDYRRGYSARRALGGGVILDAIHELDYVRWLFGDVSSVACVGGRYSRLDIGTEDTAGILLKFKAGLVGEVHLDYVQRDYSRTCQVIGDEGTIRWDFTARETRLFTARSRRWKVFRVPADWEPNDMYLDELRHFLGCLARREKPAQDVFEAARVLRVALAARRSAVQGRFVSLS